MAVGDRRVISEALGGAISLTLTLPVWYWVGARFDRKPGRTKLTRVAFWIFVSAIAFLSLVGALVFGPIDYLLYGVALWIAAVLGIALLTRDKVVALRTE